MLSVACPRHAVMCTVPYARGVAVVAVIEGGRAARLDGPVRFGRRADLARPAGWRAYSFNSALQRWPDSLADGVRLERWLLRRAANHIEQQKQHNGAYGRANDGAHNASANGDAHLSENPAADKCADDADNDISDESQAVTFDNGTGEPAGDRAYDEPESESFNRHGNAL